MSEVSADEYIKSLQDFFETAEKLFNQADADVVIAERRRSEAMHIKEEAYIRLERAKTKYKSVFGDFPPKPPFPRSKSPMSSPSLEHSSRKSTSKSPRSGSGRYRREPVLRHGGSKRHLTLSKRDQTKSVLEICKGRSREWYENNFDSESLGLVKTFYKAALGTKTNKSTEKLYISSILLNDEWNDLANTTNDIQELYIGTSAQSEDGKASLRDRAARALVQPPQLEPLAVFFAPKNKFGTDNVYYGGHWKVAAGNMLEPPQVVKGQPRQCLIKFVFAGIDRNIVNAINC
jgi:hypothetical protein